MRNAAGRGGAGDSWAGSAGLLGPAGASSRWRVLCAGGVPEGLSPHLCIKGYFGEEGAPYAHIGEGEARFIAKWSRGSQAREL